MIVHRRGVALSVGLFCSILLLGGWPYAGAVTAFSRIYCPFLNAGLSLFELGAGGHARVAPLEEVSRQPGDNVDADAILVLSVDGVGGELPFGISLRRDVFLPWLILVALLAAAPISLIARLGSPVIAAPIAWAASVGAYALLSMWTFATQLRGVYTLAPTALRFTDFVYGALLAPPGNRFIGPLALGMVIVFLDRRSRKTITDVDR